MYVDVFLYTLTGAHILKGLFNKVLNICLYLFSDYFLNVLNLLAYLQG